MESEITEVLDRLRSLYDGALSSISRLKTLGTPDTKDEIKSINAEVESLFKQFRSCLRDLEDIAEEQDE